MNAFTFVAVATLAGTVSAFSSAAFSSVLYTQTLVTTPAAVVNADPNFGFDNCVAAEGCFGKPGLVDTPGGNLPDTFTFTFTLTAAEIALINTTTPDFGVLTVVAARDIGQHSGSAITDWLVTTLDGNALGNLFHDTIDTCPPGERGGAGYPQNTVCGPNFHTDVTATDSFNISQSILRAAAADGTITVVLDPTDSVGRLKIFSVELTAQSGTPVSEPPVIPLVLLGGTTAFLLSRRQPRRI